jgi:hypothetical protein
MKVTWDDYSKHMENEKCSKPPTRNSFFEKHSYETNMQSLELKNMYWLQTHMALGA